MITRYDNARRWRLRFSVRTLVTISTLVGAYLGCWGATMRQGVDDVSLHIATELIERYGSSEDPLEVAQRAKDAANVSATVPFIVGADRIKGMLDVERQYYFWFFGYIAKLPFEHEI